MSPYVNEDFSRLPHLRPSLVVQLLRSFELPCVLVSGQFEWFSWFAGIAHPHLNRANERRFSWVSRSERGLPSTSRH